MSDDVKRGDIIFLEGGTLGRCVGYADDDGIHVIHAPDCNHDT